MYIRNPRIVKIFSDHSQKSFRRLSRLYAGLSRLSGGGIAIIVTSSRVQVRL